MSRGSRLGEDISSDTAEDFSALRQQHHQLLFEQQQFKAKQDQQSILDGRLELERQQRQDLEREKLKLFTDQKMLQFEKKIADAESELTKKREEIKLMSQVQAPSDQLVKLQNDYIQLELKFQSVTESCRAESKQLVLFSQQSLSESLVAQENRHIKAMSTAATYALEGTHVIVDSNKKALGDLGDTIGHRMKMDSVRTTAAYNQIGSAIQHFAETSDRNTFAVADGLRNLASSVTAGFQMMAAQAEATERNRIQLWQDAENRRLEDEQARRDEISAVHSNSNAVIQSYNQSLLLVRFFLLFNYFN